MVNPHGCGYTSRTIGFHPRLPAGTVSISGKFVIMTSLVRRSFRQGPNISQRLRSEPKPSWRSSPSVTRLVTHLPPINTGACLVRGGPFSTYAVTTATIPNPQSLPWHPSLSLKNISTMLPSLNSTRASVSTSKCSRLQLTTYSMMALSINPPESFKEERLSSPEVIVASVVVQPYSLVCIIENR